MSKLTVQENNKNAWENELKRLLENKEKMMNDIKLDLAKSEEKIKKLYDDNKLLNDLNKKLKKKIEINEEENINFNNQMNEISLNMKSMEDELNIKNNNINLLEKEIDK